MRIKGAEPMRLFAAVVLALLVSGCDQQWPPPRPVPGQPLTYPQYFYQQQQQLQENYDHNRR